MRISRLRARIFGVLAAIILIAASCGGGSEPTESSAEVPGQDAPGAVDAIPTTPPVAIGEDPTAVVEETATEVPEVVAHPKENIVLHVNDDVQIVPTFDAPNGNLITIYDVNAIDNVELEYPLYAETVFGNRLALRVEDYDSSGNWARVLLPVRPNGTTAWVQTAFFTEERHNYSIEVSLSDTMVRVYDGDELLVEQISVIGRESRPTPAITAYIDEKIPGADVSPSFGSWILSVAAFSETLGTFGGGGMPKLAIHGTNQPQLMGDAVSSGCVRVPNEIIEFIAENVPVGATVEFMA